MKRSKEHGGRAARPIVVVSEIQLADEEDWYTPKVLKVAPLRIEATVGKKTKGRVRCAIEETDWEHRYVDLAITFEPLRGLGGIHSSTSDEVGDGPIGTFTRDQIDRLIDALMLVRREADARGLFAPRPAPTGPEDVLAAAIDGKRLGVPRIKWPRIDASRSQRSDQGGR